MCLVAEAADACCLGNAVVVAVVEAVAAAVDAGQPPVAQRTRLLAIGVASAQRGAEAAGYKLAGVAAAAVAADAMAAK